MFSKGIAHTKRIFFAKSYWVFETDICVCNMLWKMSFKNYKNSNKIHVLNIIKLIENYRIFKHLDWFYDVWYMYFVRILIFLKDIFQKALHTITYTNICFKYSIWFGKKVRFVCVIPLEKMAYFSNQIWTKSMYQTSSNRLKSIHFKNFLPHVISTLIAFFRFLRICILRFQYI